MSQSKRWCFTVNNFSDEDVDRVLDLCPPVAKYLIVGQEKGESGTPHLQGFVVFETAWRFNRVKRFLPRAHIEPARGSSREAADYCKKEGSFEEYGECPEDTRFSADSNAERWKAARELAKVGNFDDIPDDLYIRHYNSFHNIFRDAQPNPVGLSVLNNMWIWSEESGVGKSRFLYEKYPDAYRKNCNKWWDHYCGQDVVILEDIDKSHAKLGHHIKLWGDHYPFIAEKKGGSVKIRPSVVIITSNYRPCDIWEDSGMVGPIERRFKVTHFNHIRDE